MILYPTQIKIFLLILARVIGIFLQAPVLNARTFPALGKVTFAIWIALTLWFVTPISAETLPTDLLSIFFALILEFIIGLLIGFVCNLIFIAIQSAGEIMDLQMGLSVAQSFDPIFGTQISVVGRLALFFGIVIFLIFDGHHLVLSTMHHSFSMINVSELYNFTSPQAMDGIVKLGGFIFKTAIQLAAPSILLIFLSDFTFGLVSRAAPQVNVFMLGFQVKPLLGIIGLLFTAPILVRQIARLIEKMGEELLKLLVYLK
jgi:flagellar biosynthetic protein FliR